MQAAAPNAPADTADAGHGREATIRPFEIVHARAALVITRDPSDARRLRLHAFRETRREPTQKERQLVQAFERGVRLRREGDPDQAVLIRAEIVGKAGKLRDHLARSRTRASEPQTKQTSSRG